MDRWIGSKVAGPDAVDLQAAADAAIELDAELDTLADGLHEISGFCTDSPNLNN